MKARTNVILAVIAVIVVSAFALAIALGYRISIAKPQLTAKHSFMSGKLDGAAKDLSEVQKPYSDIIALANADLNKKQQPIQTQIVVAQNELNAKLAVDPKYSPLVDKIKGLQAQLQTVTSAAQQKFAADNAWLTKKAQEDNATINGLIPLVREENGWPETATYDVATQKWTKPTASKDAPPKAH